MVSQSVLILLSLIACASLRADEAPAPSSPTAEAGLAPLPAAAPQPTLEKNHPVEDFFTVTIISLPFTAFWCTLGALAIGAAQQGHFPPEIDQGFLTGAGTAALGLSVGIGLVSVTWK